MEDEQSDKDRCVASKYLTCRSVMSGIGCLCAPRPTQESIEKVRRS